ncbi:MAG TPA: hypothetical protein VEA99_07000 [Gemmatimonadaceae bacterium]|nr:hypothetical protein [Gemmatimonadaceae bacterium]
MTASNAIDLPLACAPGAIPENERAVHFDLLTRLFTNRLREKTVLPDGYAYRFDADAFDDLARWAANERRCCPFLRFTFELTPANGPVWLRLTGPEGTSAFLDAELTR